MNEQPRPQRFIRLLLLLCLLSIPLALMLFFPQPPPAHAAGFTVNNLGDAPDDKPGDGICRTADNFCTLRAAIMEANALAGADIITFDPSVNGGTIVLGSMLPPITDTLTINGPGALLLTISGNSAVRVMVVNPGVTLNLSGVTIANGSTGLQADGGGIINDGTLNITNSTVYSNSAVIFGGGISNGGLGTLNISNTIFYSNTSFSGGGIANTGSITHSAIVTLTNSTLSGNSALAFGGGVLNDQGFTLTVTNSTFYSNTAVIKGGGIYNAISATLKMTNSTVAGNSAPGALGGGPGVGGGIFNETGGTAALLNTIVANNTASSGGNCSGAITNGGNNIDSGASCGWGSSSGSMSNTDPKLGPLANNGGPTQTMALLPGSPAIDGVTFNAPNGCPTTDQRGAHRPIGARCDIGAYEAGYLFLPLIEK